MREQLSGPERSRTPGLLQIVHGREALAVTWLEEGRGLLLELFPKQAFVNVTNAGHGFS